VPEQSSRLCPQPLGRGLRHGRRLPGAIPAKRRRGRYAALTWVPPTRATTRVRGRVGGTAAGPQPDRAAAGAAGRADRRADPVRLPAHDAVLGAVRADDAVPARAVRRHPAVRGGATALLIAPVSIHRFLFARARRSSSSPPATCWPRRAAAADARRRRSCC
jgi:hypothetical protein